VINLTDRLKGIALEIFTGETMADIGTDHGFLPIYLLEHEICTKVIMVDISEGSLEKAKINCMEANPNAQFDFRLGNGLEVLEPGEVDAVVIAGMGGLLMVEIMEKEISKTKTYKKFILQPRSAVGELRFWLVHNGFTIESECLVREGKNICEILTVSNVCEKILNFQIMQESPESIRWEVPDWHRGKDDDLTEDYILRKIAREEKILKGKMNSHTAERKSTIENIKYLKEILEG